MISICRHIFSLIFRSNYDDLIKILKVVFFVFLSLSMLLNFSVSLIYHTFPLCPANFFPYFGQDGNINGVHHGWAVTSASPGSLIYLPVINELIQTSLRVLIWLRGVVSWKKVLPMKLLTIRSVDHSRSHSPLFCSFSSCVFNPPCIHSRLPLRHLYLPPSLDPTALSCCSTGNSPECSRAAGAPGAAEAVFGSHWWGEGTPLAAGLPH